LIELGHDDPEERGARAGNEAAQLRSGEAETLHEIRAQLKRANRAGSVRPARPAGIGAPAYAGCSRTTSASRWFCEVAGCTI
jgi:hypothetical protein